MLFDTHSSVEHLAMMEVNQSIQNMGPMSILCSESVGTSSCQDGWTLKVEVLLQGKSQNLILFLYGYIKNPSYSGETEVGWR